MGNRELLIEAIGSEVILAAQEQNAVDVNYLAIKLSSRFPQSGMPINAICAEIETSLKTIRSPQSDTAA